MSAWDEYIAGMGEIDELGGEREVLPQSYYPMRLSVAGSDFYPQKQESDPQTGTVRTKGGNPYVALTGTVTAGPWEGVEVTSRVNLSPGGPESKGGFIGFINKAVKEVTGQPVDGSAMGTFGFTPPQVPAGADEKARRAAFREAFRDDFNRLEPAQRLELMRVYARLAAWEGKHAIVKVDAREVTRTLDSGQKETRTYNDFNGFFALDSEEKGLEWWKAQTLPAQEQLAKELEAAGA